MTDIRNFLNSIIIFFHLDILDNLFMIIDIQLAKVFLEE